MEVVRRRVAVAGAVDVDVNLGGLQVLVAEELFDPHGVFGLVVFLGAALVAERVEADLEEARVPEFARAHALQLL